MKTKHFNYVNPAICNDCNGTGKVLRSDGKPSQETCPTCNGTGKVLIVKEGSITVKPFEK